MSCLTALPIATPLADNKNLATAKGAVPGRRKKYLTIYAVNFKEDIATVFNFISATHKECAKRQGTQDSEAPIMAPN